MKLEIDIPMTLETYRKELTYAYNQNHLYDPLCDQIETYLKADGILWLRTAKEIATEFDQSIEFIRRCLKWLIMENRVGCDPNKTRHRTYWIEKDLPSAITLSDYLKTTKAHGLEPTIISKEKEQEINRSIDRFECLKKASEINLCQENNLLVELQNDRVMILYSPTEDHSKKIQELLKFISYRRDQIDKKGESKQ